ncbi:hypothetical protein [Spirillospora sp. NBC_01491]|uniref:hypothetical protein n=1 Tax=Spirillospora sp. NBC_01491 TaxID=2976007 RepID=UPI002E34840A|nr:hypothetical protein [Spirillospora sp. NBC_01491]
MTVILILLCLAIAGRELYLAFERKKPASAPEIADLRTQLAALRGTRDELERFRAAQAKRLDRLAADQEERFELLTGDRSRDDGALRETDARVRSLVAQINERMLPDVNARLSRQREIADRLTADVGALRAHLVGRLDQAVAASLGADPPDLVTGALTGGSSPAEEADGLTLIGLYEAFAERYELRVELTHPVEQDGFWLVRYYLSGRSPRGLERDFIDLLGGLRTGRTGGGPPADDAVRDLLQELHGIDKGCVQLGPLLIVRTAEALLCGVLPLAELLRPDAAALVADPALAADRLRCLPEGRFCDVSGWSALRE